MSSESGRELSYQWMLRALGAYLDEEPSCRLTIAEVPDGFVVRVQRYLHKLEPIVLRFRRETLNQQLQQLMKGQRPSKARHQGVWAHFPNGHQDFLRALGFELDQDGAQGVLIDELEDGIVVTYRYPDSPDRTSWKKRIVVLGRPEIETILNTAFERRQKRAVSSS